MKERLKNIITVFFCLLSVQLSAKTIYYVKSGATGTGTSWSNASGSIQDMIDEASPGDEVWIAGGTYVTPLTQKYLDAPVFYYFNLKLGVSIFGGFKGVESDLQQRERQDRNRNGKVESWEFSYETILSGYYSDEERQWKIDDENNILEIVSSVEKCSSNILYYSKYGSQTSYFFETHISGFTITGGQSACVIESSDCFVMSDCEICYNECNYQGILQLNKNDNSDYQSCIRNSTIHHNIGRVACFGNSIENSVIHHNHYRTGLVTDIKSINQSDVYANVQDYGTNVCIRVNTCISSKIYGNYTGVREYDGVGTTSIFCDTMFDSEVYKNNGHGAVVTTAYNSNFYQNGGDGGSVATAYNCEFYQNERDGGSVAVAHNCEFHKNKGIGVYISDHVTGDVYTYANGLDNCKVYQNEKDGVHTNGSYLLQNSSFYNNKGCGINGATGYNCHISNNEGGGARFCDLYDCIIENNTSEDSGGGTNGGSLYNCIIRNNFSVGDGGGCSGGHLVNCKIYNNESLSNGGGVSGGNARECSIFNNKAEESGGGTYSGEHYNCYIYNNYASSHGGIARGYYTNCTITNNKTFSGNENNGDLTNCILIGSFDGSASYSTFTDSYINGIGNFMATEKEIKLKKNTSFIGNASNEKQLEELQSADFSLLKGSSAIDMGKSGFSIPIEDKSGYPRPMGEKSDIGAHEYLTFRLLPYENKFDKNLLSMNISGRWKNDKLPGKDYYYLYYDGESSISGYDLRYLTTSFFDKTVSNKINLSFDVTAKYKTKDQQEKMHVILAYLDSNKQDTIMTFSNTDYIQDLHFSKEISSWVKNKVFRVLFAVEDSKSSDYNKKSSIVYCGITNLKITKQDASVEIIAEDKVYMYDGESHAIDYQINDTRVDKKKVVVTYQKEGETISTMVPPVKAGIYQVQISIEDGAYFGMKEVKLTIEKANQTIQWTQQLRTMKAKEKRQLEATATSGLPVSFSSEDETRAKVESINGKWWLLADTVPGEVSIKASQLGNKNYNLANSVLKTIRIESVPTGISSVATNKTTAYFVKAENCISVKNIHSNSQLYLYDSLGHLCIMKDADNTEMQIPVHELSKGVYYLLVVDRNEKENFKILIN
ncbi:T9SS type A sorting domain-containing protein [Parabacteroides gordonii]|jgi:hypothetical protein|uniref:T9SS type A sorting domain-containing protein n=1 Tax=Parabacteroides gordonii TaxID=574930 RepID=UPI00241C61BA|nr:T9SS type A sorting domain-containing protein [Parabacteroides gordonii]